MHRRRWREPRCLHGATRISDCRPRRPRFSWGASHHERAPLFSPRSRPAPRGQVRRLCKTLPGYVGFAGQVGFARIRGIRRDKWDSPGQVGFPGISGIPRGGDGADATRDRLSCRGPRQRARSRLARARVPHPRDAVHRTMVRGVEPAGSSARPRACASRLRVEVHGQMPATPALAQSSSSSPVPPPTPQAPMTRPSRTMGTPPRPRIMCPPSAATMPRKGGMVRPLGEVAARAAEGRRRGGLALAAVDGGPDCAVHALKRDQLAARIADRDADQDIDAPRVVHRARGNAVGFVERQRHGSPPLVPRLAHSHSAASGSGSARSAAGP